MSGGLRSVARALFGALVCALVLLPGCGGAVRAQWLFVVSTDAHLPSWGDRILVELLTEQGALACGGCRREIVATPESVPFSFGLVAPPDALRVRARLFRQSQTGADGLPTGQDLIDFVGLLPARSPNGVERLVLPLSGVCFGEPADLAARTACTYLRGETSGFAMLPERELVDLDIDVANLRPGRFDRALRIECPAVVPDEMACLGGSSFLMGSHESLGADSDYPTSPRFLARYLFPLLVDKDEMTVGVVRELVRTRAVSLGPSDLQRRGAAGSATAACTYLGETDPASDALPLNCVSRYGALSICRALEKELLTEIDWEYAATGAGQATLYPWGAEPPTCERAILSQSPECSRPGPVAGGAAGDVTAQGVKNLGGNLAEWVATLFFPYTDGCWRESAGGVAAPDSCYLDDRLVGWRGPWAYRGGSFSRRGSSARSAARFASPDGGPRPEIGFRCKRQLLTVK